MLRARIAPAILSAGLAMLLLLAGSAGVQAMTAAGHSVSVTDVQDQARRNVVWIDYPSTSPAAFRIDSASINAPVNDDFQITYNHGSFSLDYERVAGGPVTSQFTVTVAGLVEWMPSGDGAFSDGTVVAYTPMGAPAFGKLPVVHSQVTMPGGIVVHSFQIPSNSGELTMNLTISEGFVTLPSGSTLTPMEADLTFELNHLMNRTDSRLSIQLSLTTSTAGQQFNFANQSWDDEHQFSQDQRAVNVTNNSEAPASSAWFAWSSHADVNGQSATVDATGPEYNDTTGGYDLYLSYPRTTSMMNPNEMSIVHDPSLGVVSAAYESIISAPPNPSGIQPDIPLYLGTVAAMVALVGGTILVARRQRRGRQ